MFHATEGVAQTARFQDPPWAKTLFSDPRLGWVWLPLRLWLGYTWLEAGWGKVTSPGWMSDGSALLGFWQKATVVDPKPVVTFDWYRGFLQFLIDTQAYTWFAKIIALGEVTIGVALILGAFTGLAAFGGSLMNWNYVMAGTASSNALLFAIATWLVLAWKTAGWIGLDRWLLRWIGTPWEEGTLIRGRRRIRRAVA